MTGKKTLTDYVSEKFRTEYSTEPVFLKSMSQTKLSGIAHSTYAELIVYVKSKIAHYRVLMIRMNMYSSFVEILKALFLIFST